MKKSSARLLAFAATAVSATAYSAITGKGIFNKYKFKKEHEAIAKYVESNYPGAVYSPVQKTEKGYAVIVRKPNMTKLLLYVMPTEGGDFVYEEAKG